MSTRPQLVPNEELEPLLAAYQNAKFSEGRKMADRLLRKYPQQGDILAMKGLIMMRQGERDAGIALVRDGLAKNLFSSIPWHAWALVTKAERRYDESVKAYLQVIKLGKATDLIYRDTASLQVHARQYGGLPETRLNILRYEPKLRANWFGLAVSYRLANNLQEAKRILESIDGFWQRIHQGDATYGGFVIFYVRVLEDLGELQEALLLLDKKTKDGFLVDRQELMECRTRLFAKLKSTPEADSAQIANWTQAAEQSWRELINMNSDNHDYYKGFLANVGIDLANLTDESRTNALGFLKEFSSEHPKATASRRLALTIAQGEKFKELAKPYLEGALQKGIPSLFSDVKNLYTDADKLQTIQDIVEDIRERVSPKQPPESPVPTDYLWILYFLAQHYSFLGQQRKALEMLSIAMEHTPTLPELYMMKARVLKRVGDPYGAVRAMDDSRKLDGQDRFLNTKAGKYLLRAGMIDEADKVLGLFTKKDIPPGLDLLELQALHYLRELGDTQRRLGRYNLALKTYYNILKVFLNFREDQHDFHPYVLRKGTLKAYLDMLRWEDNLHSHPTYIHAVVWTARIWIKLYEDPSLVKSLLPPQIEELPKKDKDKAKKQALKALLATPLKVPTKKIADHGLEPTKQDEDPEGLVLVTADDQLVRASMVLSTLEVFGKDNMDVNATLFDVAIRQKKYLKAVRALRRAYAHDPQHPEVHVRIVQLAQAVASIDDSAEEEVVEAVVTKETAESVVSKESAESVVSKETVKSVVAKEPVKSAITKEMVKSVVMEALSVMKSTEVSLERFISEYLQLNSASPLAVLASAKASQFMAAPTEEVENILFTTLGEGVQLRIADALEILEYLGQSRSRRADEFRIACDEKFVLSKVFKSAKEQAALRLQCVAEEDDTEDETVF